MARAKRVNDVVVAEGLAPEGAEDLQMRNPAAVPAFTIRADEPGALRGLVELSRVVDTEGVHAALAEFQAWERAVMLTQAEEEA